MNEHAGNDLDSINRFLVTQRRRDRRDATLLGFFSLMLVGSLVIAGIALVRGMALIDALLPAGTTLLAAVLLARQWRALLATRAHYRAMSLPTREVVQRLLGAVRQRIRETRMLMGLVLLGMLPLFTLAAWQLAGNGKMSGTDALGFMSLVIVAVITVLGVHWHRLTHEIRPQARALQEIAGQFDN